MAERWFITATDTDAGKTWLTASLIRAMRAREPDALALKPVACGVDADGRHPDLDALLAAQRMTAPDRINRYRFAAACAPAQAAAREGARIDMDELTRWCAARADGAKICLIEGVGGLMVPLDGKALVRDWIAAMPGFRVCLVVACRLGAINHALLSLEALRAIGRAPELVICNAPRADDEAWLAPVADAIRPWIAKDARLLSLGHAQQPSADWLSARREGRERRRRP